MSQRLVVPPGVATRRLDVYLAAKLGWSRATAASAIKDGHVLLNDAPVRASRELSGGEVILVTREPAALAANVPLAAVPKIPVVYEDDDLMVLDKPAGIAVHAGNAQPEAGTVVDFMRTHTTDDDPARPGIVHRLDKGTSGLLVVAKHTAAKAALQKLWHDRSVQKTYVLLAVGRVDPPEAVITLPLGRDTSNPTRQAVAPSGRAAVTRYRTLATYPGYTYVEAKPETGRTHQLRVHFAALGHPIVGDRVYGAAAGALGLSRQFLHATRLQFVAPSGKSIDLSSPLPPDLAQVLTKLEESV